MSSDPLILASGSAIRAQVLSAAGLTFEVVRPLMDEEALKAGLRAADATPRDLADALAEAKALSVSRTRPGFVIGADQVLALGEETFDKPADLPAAAETLRRLRGQTHSLISALVLAKDGVAIWRHIETPRLTMRPFSDSFLESYLAQAGESVCASVGAYQLESLGAQLFSRVEGDFFSVLGMPLFPLLGILREHGVVQT